MAGSTNEIDIIQSFQVDGCNTVKALIGDIGLSYTPTAFNVEYGPITWTLDSFGGDIKNAVINSLTGEITYDATTVLVNNGNANFVVTATDDLGTKVTKNFCFKISDPILIINLACNGDLQEYRNDIVQKLVLFAKAESGYLFQNLAKTIPSINNGDPVLVVENSTGLGDIVAENGSPKLAIDNVDVGLDSIEFDGFSNLQYQPLTVPSQGDAFKLVFLAKVDATNDFATFISGTDATLGQDAILKSGTWQLANYNGFLSLRSGIDAGFTSITLGNYAGTAYVNSITPWQDVNNGQYHLFAADYDGTNFKLYFDGQLVLDVVPISDFYGSSINLFRNINQAAYLKGYLAEFIYGDNTMTYTDFIDTQAYFICKYGLDASLLAYASPFAVDLDNCYETVSQFEYQKLSNGTEVVYDVTNNTYYTLGNVPTPGLGLLKNPQCGGESTPNIDYVLYATDNVVPTLAPPNGVDTTVLLDGTRYEWNGSVWVLQPLTVDGNERKLTRANSTPSVAPTVLEIPTPVNGDTATIRLLNNNIEHWNYTAGAWVLVFTQVVATFDSTVDFNTANPNTGGTVFTPNTPASTTVLYVSSLDGSQWTYNGTTYVTAPISSDWKVTGNAGTVQATNFVGTTDNVGLSFRTDNVIRQTITNTGNVGIGLATPTTKLHIVSTETSVITAEGNNTNAIIEINNTNASATNYTGVRMNKNGVEQWLIGTSGVNANGDFAIRRLALVPFTILQSNGNVGINTTTPTAKLHVNGTFTTQAPTAAANQVANFTISTAQVDVASVIVFNQTTAGILLTAIGSPTSTTVGRFLRLHNIGTASFSYLGDAINPGTFLDLQWNGTAWAKETSNSSSLPSVNGGLLFGNGTTQVQDATNLFYDDTNNRLGIGTTIPTVPLDVNGEIKGTRLIANGAGAITSNVAVGGSSLIANTTGTSNTAVGFQALFGATTASNSVAIGGNALQAITTGNNNIAIGSQALRTNTIGSSNIAVGGFALATGTGNSNIAIGHNSALAATSAIQNVTIGGNALANNTTGANNTVIGHNTGAGIITGGANTIIGANVTGLASGLSGAIILADGGGNTRIFADNLANVGIGTGTAAPTAKLQVLGASASVIRAGGTSTNTLIEIDNTNASLSNYIGVRINKSGAEKWVVGTSGLNTNGDFVIRRNSASDAITIANATGNVGIGTTAPTSNIHINGSEAGSITTITATTALNATHHKILVSNGATNITITLPDALTCLGREYIFSRANGSTGSITLQGTGTNIIQALNGTTGATTSIGLHTATGGGLKHSFTAVNIGGVGFWVRL